MSFVPRFIQECELTMFGLPTAAEQNDILSLVDNASVLIDEYCGRVDMNGKGSLIYSTYYERLHLPQGRNLVRLTYKPLVALTPATVADLTLSGIHFLTPNLQANTVVKTNSNVLSPIVSLSGRYGYSRRGEQQVYPDLNYGANVLQIASYFGGPPQFTPVDIGFVDFNEQVAEIWMPAGLYLSQYSEIEIQYNSGYDPRDLPSALKHATANIVRNAMIRGCSTTGITNISGVGKINIGFTDDLIDPTTQKLLRSYVTVIAI